MFVQSVYTFNFFKLFFKALFILYVLMFYLYASVCPNYMHTWFLWSQEKGIRSFGTGVMNEWFWEE